MAITEEIRKTLCQLARDRNKRTTVFTREAPTEWRPNEVKNQSDSADFIPYFLDDSAWNYIADLLEAGHDVEIISLNKPPNTVGYVMHIETRPNEPLIYVKLQLGAAGVIGRSFHYDT